jgi:hypothetical protein
MREFVDKEIMPFCHEWDEEKAIPKELWAKYVNSPSILSRL